MKEKEKVNLKTRWLTLNLYKNCFGEGDGTHLGIKYKGIYYCITHSGGNGIEISKDNLKMRNISDKREYFKQCTDVPELINSTKMKISERFIIAAILSSELNKL